MHAFLFMCTPKILLKQLAGETTTGLTSKWEQLIIGTGQRMSPV